MNQTTIELNDMLHILNKFTDLSDKIDKLTNEIKSSRSKDEYQSEYVDQLYAALSKAQGEYKEVKANRENPFFKSQYADLDSYVEATREALVKYGLCFRQQIRTDESGAITLHTRLGHSSGQWEESRNRIVPMKDDPQSYGSMLSYMQRYAAKALLGITCSFDNDDDDGEVAMKDVRYKSNKGTSPTLKYDPRQQSVERINKAQLEEIEYLLADEEYKDIVKTILETFHIQSLADIPLSKFRATMARVHNIINIRKGLIEPNSK